MKQWDTIIETNRSFFQFQFKELWRYRDLLILFVKRDFISFYKQTVLGPIWFFLQPVMTTLVFTFVFGNLAGIATDGAPKPLFFLAGIVCWNYFAECITKTSTVFRDNVNILGKVYFPRIIMPLSIVTSNLVKFGVQILLLLLVYIYYLNFGGFDSGLNGYIFLIPLLILMMAALGLGLGMIISAMTTKYRDLAFLVSFGVQLLMYATTVVYPLSEAQKRFSDYPVILAFLEYNPMTAIIEGFRKGLFGNGSFSMNMFIWAFFITSFILFLGIIVFNKVEKDFVDTV